MRRRTNGTRAFGTSACLPSGKFFWPAAIVLVAAANYLIPSRCAPFEIEPYIYARILVQAVYISTILLTLGVVSTVFRLQLAYFKRRMR